MSLFEECKNALKNDFQIISDIDVDVVYKKLNMYPIKQNYILWKNIDFKDFDDMDELLESMKMSMLLQMIRIFQSLLLS